MTRWLLVLAACGGGGKYDSVWALDVTVPSGWTRENIAIGKTEGIELKSAGAEAHIYFTDDDKVFPSGAAYIQWKNHRYWNDEVKISIPEEVKLDDGWVAHFVLQTRVRPTPDTMVYSTREIAGRHVDCVCDHPHDPMAVPDAIAICKSVRFDPDHGSAASLAKPPPDWQVRELEVDLPDGWTRSVDKDQLVLESPAHDKLDAYRYMGHAIPTFEAFVREEHVALGDIVAKRVLADGVVIGYHVGAGSLYVRGSRTIDTRNFRCAAIVKDEATAEVATRLCAELHR